MEEEIIPPTQKMEKNMQDLTHSIEVPNVSEMAENFSMSVKSLIAILDGVVQKSKGELYFESYSEEYNSCTIGGTETGIEKFVSFLDRRFGCTTGGSSEESFGNLVERM